MCLGVSCPGVSQLPAFSLSFGLHGGDGRVKQLGRLGPSRVRGKSPAVPLSSTLFSSFLHLHSFNSTFNTSPVQTRRVPLVNALLIGPLISIQNQLYRVGWGTARELYLGGL